jgi:hypothetical protein
LYKTIAYEVLLNGVTCPIVLRETLVKGRAKRMMVGVVSFIANTRTEEFSTHSNYTTLLTSTYHQGWNVKGIKTKDNDPPTEISIAPCTEPTQNQQTKKISIGLARLFKQNIKSFSWLMKRCSCIGKNWGQILFLFN